MFRRNTQKSGISTFKIKMHMMMFQIQMTVIQYFYTEYIDDDDFNIPILKIQMMFQYLHTVDADDGDLMMLSVLTY